jgi:hypothetical protein
MHDHGLANAHPRAAPRAQVTSHGIKRGSVQEAGIGGSPLPMNLQAAQHGDVTTNAIYAIEKHLGQQDVHQILQSPLIHIARQLPQQRLSPAMLMSELMSLRQDTATAMITMQTSSLAKAAEQTAAFVTTMVENLLTPLFASQQNLVASPCRVSWMA